MTDQVKHDRRYQQFTIKLGDDDAELAYSLPEPHVMDFTHTYIPESVRGTGLAQTLIAFVLDYAVQNRFRIMATCPVVAAYLKRHPEFQFLVYQKH